MSELMDFVNVELKKRKIRKIDFAEGVTVSYMEILQLFCYYFIISANK